MLAAATGGWLVWAREPEVEIRSRPAAPSARATDGTDAPGRDRAAKSGAAPYLAAFRRERTADDAVPAAVSQGPLLAGDIADEHSSRRLHLAPQRPGWVLPARDPDEVCFVTAGVSSCSPHAGLARKGLLPTMSVRPGEPTRVEGLVADGVGELYVEDGGGGARPVEIHGNGFSVELSPTAVALRWQSRNGRHRFVLPSRNG